MPGPHEKFEIAFETFQEELKELLTTQQTQLLEALRTVPPPTPAPAPNPLAFYETILKIESFPQIGIGINPPVHPYFPDVYNDVVRYFGGPQTTDPMGKRFLEEVQTRFAYLLDDDLKQTILFPAGVVRRSFAQKDQNGKFTHTYLDFDERDFAALRQLLEDLYKDYAVDEHKKELTILTKQLQKELETQQQQLRQELDKRQQQQVEQFAGIITSAFDAFRGKLTQDITNIPPTTIKQLETKLAAFREKMLQDIQAYIKTDAKEKELDKAVTTMQKTLEVIQKTRGIHGDNSQQSSPPEDPAFKF